jgi:hypothetical protein
MASYAKRSRYDIEIPELDEDDFVFSASTGPHIEDANDFGSTGDSISFSLDANFDISAFDA